MTSKEAPTLILDHKKIGQKITRIAYEILENNYKEDALLIIGIEKDGFILAQRIAFVLNEICNITITLQNISINKKNPLSAHLHPAKDAIKINHQVIILVDDVLNSGKTLAYTTKYLLDYTVKGIQTVCLIDRKHRKFPINADYVGVTLSTTLQEHITVSLGDVDTVYLD